MKYKDLLSRMQLSAWWLLDSLLMFLFYYQRDHLQRHHLKCFILQDSANKRSFGLTTLQNRGLKSFNFPVGRLLSAKTFWMKWINCFRNITQHMPTMPEQFVLSHAEFAGHVVSCYPSPPTAIITNIDLMRVHFSMCS